MKNLILISFICLLSACANKNNYVESFDNAHNAENALDWAGIYVGELPCADCTGIVTTLTLTYNNEFKLQETYNTDRFKDRSFVTSGVFTWDDSGSKVILKTDHGNRYFFVGERHITALDAEGNPIESNLDYVLQQVKQFN